MTALLIAVHFPHQEHELEHKMQALRQSEWEKRVALEQEVTVLEEKLADLQR